MKNIALIIFGVSILLSHTTSVAQSIPLLPDNSAQWEYRTWDPGGQMHLHQYILGDTIIDTISYTKYRIDAYEYTHNPDGGAVYGSSEFFIYTKEGLVIRRGQNGSDILIFDSFWAVGDTIIDDLNTFDTIVVERIDTVEVGGVQRRKWNFLSISPECSHCSAGFIEGIGTTNYNLSSPAYTMFWEAESDLICFRLWDENVISEFCRFSTKVEANKVSSKIKLYPNPVSDLLHIESNVQFSIGATMSIFNAFGQPVYLGKIDNLNDDIDISGLSPGIYMVKIFDGNRNWHDPLIVL